nr:uncharacterized protein LOC113689656 [Coffea arabica]
MRATPFTDDINGEMVPPNFKLPNLHTYDGRGDPEDHLRAFISAFRLYCDPDAVTCRVFPIFLHGTARKWFWSLEPRSISSLDELIDRFIHRFVSSRPITKTSAYLLNLQQTPGESLRSYAQRFNEENVQIPDQNEQVTIATFTNGLIAGIFNTEIHRDYPRTLRELWERVDQGIQCEDVNRMKREAQAARTGQESRRRKDTGRAEQGPGSSSNQFRDRRSVFDRIVKGRSSTSDAELTPLNSSRSHVLAVMRQNHLGRTPPEIPGRSDKRNFNLYCAYHRDVGHETEDCNDLKRDIENLIRQGYLKQFVRKDGGFNRSASYRESRGPRREDRRDTKLQCQGPEEPKGDQRPPRDRSPGYGPNIAGVINTIAGGPTGGDSQNSRKRTYRQAGMEVAESSSRLSEMITYGPHDPVPAASSNHETLVIEGATHSGQNSPRRLRGTRRPPGGYGDLDGDYRAPSPLPNRACQFCGGQNRLSLQHANRPTHAQCLENCVLYLPSEFQVSNAKGGGRGEQRRKRRPGMLPRHHLGRGHPPDRIES